MRKPSESIDDYIVPPPPKPPRSVSLRRTGEVEVLKPIALEEVSLEPERAAYMVSRRRVRRPQPLWFRRFLAVGSGALVMIGLILITAILVGINDPAGPDVAIGVTPTGAPTPPEEPFTFDLSTPLTFATPKGRVRFVRPMPRRRPIRSSVPLADIKPRQQSHPSLQIELPKFVPTTLVIYAENGVINTRIEPWVQESN